MSNILNTLAIGAKKDDDARDILQAYIATGPAMALSHTHTPEATPQPSGGAARPKGAGGDIDPFK